MMKKKRHEKQINETGRNNLSLNLFLDFLSSLFLLLLFLDLLSGGLFTLLHVLLNREALRP